MPPLSKFAGFLIYLCILLLGVGSGEGNEDQGVNVDDGTAAVGTVDDLVHQTVCSPLYFRHLHDHPPQGDFITFFILISFFLFLIHFLILFQFFDKFFSFYSNLIRIFI